MSRPTIAELVAVVATDTVVRLDGRGGRLSELVLTGDVEQAMAAVLAAARPDAGGGAFFLVGHFGSGKSHLLAALVELLNDRPDAVTGLRGPNAVTGLRGPNAVTGLRGPNAVTGLRGPNAVTSPVALAGWPGPLREAAGRARSFLPVAVPLVEHRSGAHLDDVVLDAAWAAVGGTSPSEGTDRRAAWEGVLEAGRTEGRAGLVVVLDELSEFLRAKQGPDLHEDLRFLQFMGEWAGDRPVVVVAALQESIEEVANVSQRELARIRDRYRTLSLSMRHVEDLVRGRLVRLLPGSEEWVERAHRQIEAAFPGSAVGPEQFARCYPLHPATLAVLEGLRFLFSQQRGVVDFICRQLLGDSPSGIPPWQHRDYLDLLTPDRVYDHFRGRLHERIETRRLAEAVVPYYERAVHELFDEEPDRVLALRVVKLLSLLTASPIERPRTAPELAHLLLARTSALDPAASVAYLERAILEPLVGRGAYVVAHPGPPRTYTVELEADGAEVAQARTAQVRADLSPGDRRVVRTLSELGSSSTLPLRLLAEVGPSRRELLWQNTLRALLVAPVCLAELEPSDAAAVVRQARDLGAEGCLLVAEPELDDVDLRERARHLAAATERLVVWAPAPFGADDAEAAREVHVRRLVLDAARAEGRTEPGGLVELLGRTAGGDEARARELLHRAYFGGTVACGPGSTEVDLPTLAGLAFDRLLVALVDPLLARLHPRHSEVAPRGPLVGERLLRQLVVDVLPQPRIGAAAADRGQLRPLLTGYLAPLGLVRRRGDAYVVAPDPARSPAVAEALRLVPGSQQVPAAEVMRLLADGPVGLTEPEALLVLNACVQSGLLEARRGNRHHRDPFLAVTPADRLSTGELAEPGVRAALAGLGPAVGQGPFEPWNASVQRAVWERARAWLEARHDDVAAVGRGMEAVADSPLLADTVSEPTLSDLATVGSVVDGCDPGLGPVPGLRRLVACVGDAEAMLTAARRLAAVARFLREDMGKVEQAAAYLAHSQLEIPVGEERLVVLREEARRLLPDVLRLAAEDRAGELLGLEREFRRAYVATYRHAHERHHAGAGVERVEAVRSSPAYRALTALADLGVVAVPDDRVKVDRALAAALPERCRRNLDLELSWKPRCTCGFALGQSPPEVDTDALVGLADRGVGEHLAELAQPEHRARLERVVEDLGGLSRDELAADLRRLLVLLGDPAGADRVAVAHLLGGPLAAVVADVLAGGQLVVRRDLAALREDLIGRRYPKRRLLALLAAWVDAGADLPAVGVVEVVDSDDRAEARGSPRSPDQDVGGATVAPGTSGGTDAFLAWRFPRLAALAASDRPGETFWLAAWWAARGEGTRPPSWLPPALVAERQLLAAAADAARADLGARAELADLDARVGPESVLGDQVAAALCLSDRPGREVAAVLAGERLLRHPLRLAADELVRRLAAEWQLAERLPQLDPARLAAEHALVGERELAFLEPVLAAARGLARLERGLAGATCRDLVEDLYPSAAAPVPELLSRAELAAVGGALLSTEALDSLRTSSTRLLRAADAALRVHADAGFPGCLRIWEVGQAVLAPLLRLHERVAVLLVDAMRADLWHLVRSEVSAALAGRLLRQAWAVVPEPTRTAEAMAALYLGRPVAAGDGPASPAEMGLPFAHLGFEATAMVGVDREGSAEPLRELWARGPRISMAVATGVDALVHRSSVELAGLLDEAAAGLQRRVLPTLTALPPHVPLVVLADHGFRENPSWGRGRADRYGHGGPSLEESVVPVAVFGPVNDRPPPSMA